MIRLTSSLFQLESCHLNNIFIPFISQTTKCKVSISNFKLNTSLIERNPDLPIILSDNVRLLKINCLDFNFVVI